MTNGALCSSHLDEIPAERCQLANTITLCEPNTKHWRGERGMMLSAAAVWCITITAVQCVAQAPWCYLLG